MVKPETTSSDQKVQISSHLAANLIADINKRKGKLEQQRNPSLPELIG
jgi:hypothetical protein